MHHPDIHRAASPWSEAQTLHVAACYSNPFRWEARRRNASDFRRHLEACPNVVLHFVECAYGDRPFEVTSPDNPRDLQLRTSSELFHKENLLNLAIARFPADWRYGAIVDADFHFTRHDWALEAVHQLQMYEWVQLFSHYVNVSGRDLGRGHRPLGGSNSFAFNWHANGYALPSRSHEYGHRQVGATGGAWAFRRQAFDTVGGLLDRCILGSADYIMAFALVGETILPQAWDKYSSGYRDFIQAWRDRARRCTRNVGYVDQLALHHFHGPKSLRGYSTRDDILIRHQYSPVFDVAPDAQGVLALSPERPELRDDIRRYFLSRSEDYPHPTGRP